MKNVGLCLFICEGSVIKLNEGIYRQSPIFLLLTKDIRYSYNANMATFYHLETARHISINSHLQSDKIDLSPFYLCYRNTYRF